MQRKFPGQRAVPTNNMLAREEDYPIYDTFLVGSGLVNPGELLFFSVPRGQIGSGFLAAKTRAETNLDTSSKLPQGVVGAFDRIMVQITPAENQTALDQTAADDARNLIASLALGFTNLGLNRTYGPVDMYPAGGGIVTDLSGLVGAAGGLNISNGSPSFPATRRIHPPVLIQDGGQFNFPLYVERSITLAWQWRIRVALTGSIQREVTQG